MGHVEQLELVLMWAHHGPDPVAAALVVFRPLQFVGVPRVAVPGVRTGRPEGIEFCCGRVGCRHVSPASGTSGPRPSLSPSRAYGQVNAPGLIAHPTS